MVTYSVLFPLLIPDSLIYKNPDMTKKQIARLAGYSEKIMYYKIFKSYFSD